MEAIAWTEDCGWASIQASTTACISLRKDSCIRHQGNKGTCLSLWRVVGHVGVHVLGAVPVFLSVFFFHLATASLGGQQRTRPCLTSLTTALWPWR
jgi:hypothetical protein